MKPNYIRKNNCEWHLGTAIGINLVALVLLTGGAGAAPYAYITNHSNTVSVIDTAKSVLTSKEV